MIASRRTFLAGLLAATALAPIAARVAPSLPLPVSRRTVKRASLMQYCSAPIDPELQYNDWHIEWPMGTFTRVTVPAGTKIAFDSWTSDLVTLPVPMPAGATFRLHPPVLIAGTAA